MDLLELQSLGLYFTKLFFLTYEWDQQVTTVTLHFAGKACQRKTIAYWAHS